MQTKLFSEIAEDYQSNKVRKEDGAFHNWYRFVLSFPPHLVKYYLDKFNLDRDSLILDPFSGTGTTLVESKINNYYSVGIEANPITRFASETKLDWHIDVGELIDGALDISREVDKQLKKKGIDDYNLESIATAELKSLPEESSKILLKNSISPIPLHKSILLIEKIRQCKNKKIKNHLLLARL